MSNALNELASNSCHIEDSAAFEATCILLTNVSTKFEVYDHNKRSICFRFCSEEEEKVINDYILSKLPGQMGLCDIKCGLKFKYAPIGKDKDRAAFRKEKLSKLTEKITHISITGGRFVKHPDPANHYPSDSYDDEGKFCVHHNGFVMYNDKVVVNNPQGTISTYAIRPIRGPRKERFKWEERYLCSTDGKYSVGSRSFTHDVTFDKKVIMSVIKSFDTFDHDPKISTYLKRSTEACIAEKKRKREFDDINDRYRSKIAKLQREIADLVEKRKCEQDMLEVPLREVNSNLAEARRSLESYDNIPWVPRCVHVKIDGNDKKEIRISRGQFIV